MLKEKLKKIELQGETQRKGRDGIARVSLVGYTNVGKSTLMNLIAKADIFAENKLFATVDSTVRKVHMDGVNFLLADTVGLATPEQVAFALKTLIPQYPQTTIGVHLHSSPQNRIPKLAAALQAGCTRFDGAIKGIGGCPMAQEELVGNMDTINLFSYFAEMQYNKEAFLQAIHLSNQIFI